jgi:hypothetical protein
MSRSGRRATVEARDVPVIDTFQFANPVSVPATVSFKIESEAIGSPVQLGSGNAVPATVLRHSSACSLRPAPPASFRVPNSGSASYRSEAPALISATRSSEQSGMECSSHSAAERRAQRRTSLTLEADPGCNIDIHG